MIKKIAGAVLALGLFVVGAASPVAAHEGHASCRASGQFAASLARALGSGFGEAASALAQQGQADDFVAATHERLCEPRP